jgi:hypothetical protein
MYNKHRKRFPTLSVISEIQIKAKRRHFILISAAKVTKDRNIGEDDVGKMKP